jgi:hypothetical protein
MPHSCAGAASALATVVVAAAAAGTASAVILCPVGSFWLNGTCAYCAFTTNPLASASAACAPTGPSPSSTVFAPPRLPAGLPAFVIHHAGATDRAEHVAAIINATGATVVDAVWLTGGGHDARKRGCLLSHTRVAALASDAAPSSWSLVFEDDAVLAPDWADVLRDKQGQYDLVYIGVNSLSSSNRVPFGTHAMFMSPAVRAAVVANSVRFAPDVQNPWAFDHVLSIICTRAGFRVWVPDEPEWARWVAQRTGLVSSITGRVRGDW